MGDNGRPNDNMLMQILSPYPVYRSALTDGPKLQSSGLSCRLALLINGVDYPQLPIDPGIEAFEALSRRSVHLSERSEAAVHDLVHPVHGEGRILCWEILGLAEPPTTPG